MPTPLDREPYISLETFKRDGNGVRTPVWAATVGDRLVVFTEGSSFKVKRIRRDPRCRVTACDVRGGLKGGPWLEGTVRILEDAGAIEDAYRALRAKYGIQMRVGDFFSRLVGRYQRRLMLEITLTPST